MMGYGPTCGAPAKTKWLYLSAYIGWLLFLGLIWLHNASWIDAALASAHSALAECCAAEKAMIDTNCTALFS